MRIIFLGTPEFAIPALEKLAKWGQVVAVLCQPDRPSGRGQRPYPPAVKIKAQELGITVFQPEKLSKSPEIVQAMRDLKPDVLVTVAFGQILKKEVLELAPWGVVNLHGSLLPKYRGPAPIQWAVINGETKTGLTTMFSDVGVDTGDMLLKTEVPIDLETNAEQLAHTLANVGADLLVRTLEQIQNKTIKREKQDESMATHAPFLTKEMGQINWQNAASKIHNLVRGLYPWPGTYTQFAGAALKILKTHVSNNCSESLLKPGQIIGVGNTLQVACGLNGQEIIEIVEVKPANRSKMAAKDWANGVRLAIDMNFE